MSLLPSGFASILPTGLASRLPRDFASLPKREFPGKTYWLAIWSLLLGLVAIFAALYVTLHTYVSSPFEDQWTIIEELYKHNGHYTLPLLWALHNEHRTPFAKILETIDLYWFHGRNVSNYVDIYLMQSIFLVVFSRALRRIAAWPLWLVAVGTGLIAFALFWVSQAQSFNPLGVGIVPASAFATFSLLALAMAYLKPERVLLWTSLSLASAFVVEGTLANGLLLWPLLLFLGWRLKFRREALFLIAAVGFVASVAYVWNYHKPSGMPQSSFMDFDLMTNYLITYFGNPWAGPTSRVWRTFAILGFIGAVVFFLREIFRAKPRVFSLCVLSVCMFAIGTGVLTAAGRAQFGIAQATASRYQSSVLLFWLCLALYGLDVIRRYSLRTQMEVVAAILLITSTICYSFDAALNGQLDEARRVNDGSLPLYSDVRDGSIIQGKLYAAIDSVFQERQFLRAIPAAAYADWRYRELGMGLGMFYHEGLPGRCLGAFDHSVRVSEGSFPGWRLSGWAWDRKYKRPIEDIIVVGEGGVISGWGISNIARPDVHAARPEVKSDMVGWHAYLQGAADTTHASVYGVLNDNEVCAIETNFTLPRP